MGFTAGARCGTNIVPGVRSSFSFPLTGVPHRGAPDFRDRSDLIEVIETMTHETNNEATAALHALLDGAEGCGPAARSARLAHDDELADFLCGVQDEIVGEARRLLAQRVAE